jgi:regulatory protein
MITGSQSEQRMAPIDPPDDEAPARTGKRRRPELTPAQRALGLLVRREHSRKELTRKLAARGVEAEQAQAAVDRMTAEGWQNDARFAELLVRSRASTGYGPLRIRAELSTHNLGRETIAAAMEGFDGDWTENARDLVRRRFPGALDDRAIQRKAADLLIRRGFTGDQVRTAIRLDDDD